MDNTPEDTEIRVWFDTKIGHSLCPEEETDDNCLVSELLNLITLHTIEARKQIADDLIDKEGKLYKIYKSNKGDDRLICVGIKIMADRVRGLYDEIELTKGDNEMTNTKATKEEV